MSRLDWTIVRTAATAGLIILVPAALLASLLFDDRPTSGWRWLFLVVALIGFAVAGFVAGRLRNDTPMLHGAISAFVACVVAQVFGLATMAAGGGTISWIAIPLTGLLAVTMGVAGALVSDHTHRRSARLA